MTTQVQSAVSRPLFQEIQIWIDPIVEKIQQIWKYFVEAFLSTGEVISFLSFRVFEAFDPSRAPRVEALWLRCVRFYETVCHGIENDALRKENEQLKAAFKSQEELRAELLIANITVQRQKDEIEHLKEALDHSTSLGKSTRQILSIAQQRLDLQRQLEDEKNAEIAALNKQRDAFLGITLKSMRVV